MSDPIARALALWGLEGSACAFVAGRENRVYRVRTDAGDFALRFKRPGYRTDAELLSELHWVAAMGQAGLRIPLPVPSRSGNLLEKVRGERIDMVRWLDGAPLDHAAEAGDRPDIFRRLGAELARLHAACDAWTPPEGFTRCAWDIEGLLGDRPVWGRFWDNPMLDAEMRRLLLKFRDAARADLEHRASGLDYGLIHADPVRENVLLADDSVALIDFDDGGFGFRIFDVATALAKAREMPEFAALKESLVAGYRALRPLDTTALDLFLALRAATYLGWIAPRLEEEGGHGRLVRFASDARALCASYLETA